ncbi:MAG: alpha/beta hydrolase, partial [Polaromonas sp.]
MIEPTLNYVTCPDAAGGHRMAYWQWGRADSAHVVLCVHGLSRQGRDFDVLARALCAKAEGLPGGIRVICPDVVGRGESDWLKDPMGYQVPAYAADMLALLGQLHAQAPVATLDWVGTSMGGLIGMVVCGQPGLPVPVRRLVLNDVGPAIQWEAIVRIGTYLGKSGSFASEQEAADAMWAISSS